MAPCDLALTLVLLMLLMSLFLVGETLAMMSTSCVSARTPLHDAAEACKVTEANFWIALLPRTAVDAPDRNGLTALHLASRRGCVDILSVLHRAGANVSVRTSFFRRSTALHDAVAAGRLSAVRFLRSVSRDLDAVDEFGETALHWVARSEADDVTPIVLALRDAGANVDAVDLSGETPLMHAVSRRNAGVSVMDALITAGVDVNAEGSQALHVALRLGSSSHALGLIEAGINVNGVDAEGNTPLHLAAASHPELVSALLDAGAHVANRNANGDTPLHAALRSEYGWSCSDASVVALISAGADVNAVASDGNTPLLLAADVHNCECMSALLRAGANVSFVGRDGSTALRLVFDGMRHRYHHLDADESLVKRAHLLLDAGANPSAGNGPGLGFLVMTRYPNCNSLLELSLRAGADANLRADHASRNALVHFAAFAAASRRNLDVLGIVLRAGADVNSATTNGTTALHIAAKHDIVGKVVRLLLDAGANVSSMSNSTRCTPLHVAANYGRLHAAAELISAGAPLDVVCPLGGSTPLLVAVTAKHHAIAELLRKAGAAM